MGRSIHGTRSLVFGESQDEFPDLSEDIDFGNYLVIDSAVTLASVAPSCFTKTRGPKRGAAEARDASRVAVEPEHGANFQPDCVRASDNCWSG